MFGTFHNQLHQYHHKDIVVLIITSGSYIDKLAKLRDSIDISKSETITD